MNPYVVPETYRRLVFVKGGSEERHLAALSRRCSHNALSTIIELQHLPAGSHLSMQGKNTSIGVHLLYVVRRHNVFQHTLSANRSTTPKDPSHCFNNALLLPPPANSKLACLASHLTTSNPFSQSRSTMEPSSTGRSFASLLDEGRQQDLRARRASAGPLQLDPTLLKVRRHGRKDLLQFHQRL